MIYLDYSATTPVHPQVLADFVNDANGFYANPNSLYDLGRQERDKIEEASAAILSFLRLSEREVIYTSGATEANNLAIKGACLHHQHLGKHLITTTLEHGSVTASFAYLQKMGFEVDFAPLDASGHVDIENLCKLIRPDTIFISIGAVSSEIGIVQDVAKIAKMIKESSSVIFHSDMTQAFGKINLDVQNIDLISFAPHKFYGFKGIGGLIRNQNIELTPLIHGGKSVSKFRAGTPPTPLILSVFNALKLAYEEFSKKAEYVADLRHHLVQGLQAISGIHLNSFADCIPHIVNFSMIQHESHHLQLMLAKQQIYVSTQSACSSDKAYSKIVYQLTGDEQRARSSIRVSLSSLTTFAEIDDLLSALKEASKR